MDLTHPSHTSMNNTLRGLSRKLDAYLKLKSNPPLSLVHAHLEGGGNIQPQHFGRQQDGGMEGRLDGWMDGWTDGCACVLPVRRLKERRASTRYGVSLLERSLRIGLRSVLLSGVVAINLEPVSGG